MQPYFKFVIFSPQSVDVCGMDVYTAPVFRSKPEIDVGFLYGGFWKYSAKSSNLFPFGETSDEETEGKHTIQDDIFVAGQDFAAGLIRMGILPRIRYLLEVSLISYLFMFSLNGSYGQTLLKNVILYFVFIEKRKDFNVCVIISD